MSDWIKKIINQRFKKTTNNEDSWKFENKDNEHFFFMHIPKCGGTTFRFILYNHFEEEDLWPNKKELDSLGGRYPSLKITLEIHRAKLKTTLIMGHYDISILNHLPPSTKKIVFFRNPIDRSLSLLKHLYEKRDDQSKGDINDFLQLHLGQIVYQVRKMLGFGNKTMPQNILDEKIGDFDFIGITEEFDLSIQLCNKMFGWNLKNISPLNVRNNELLKELTPSSTALIVQRLIPEIRIYNKAVARFKKLCKVHLEVNNFKI